MSLKSGWKRVVKFSYVLTIVIFDLWSSEDFSSLTYYFLVSCIITKFSDIKCYSTVLLLRPLLLDRVVFFKGLRVLPCHCMLLLRLSVLFLSWSKHFQTLKMNPIGRQFSVIKCHCKNTNYFLTVQDNTFTPYRVHNIFTFMKLSYLNSPLP